MELHALVLEEGLEDKFKGQPEWCWSLRDVGSHPRCVTNFKYFPVGEELDKWKGKAIDERVVIGIKDINPPYNGVFRLDGKVLSVGGNGSPKPVAK